MSEPWTPRRVPVSRIFGLTGIESNATPRRRMLEHFVIGMLSESSGARLISTLLIRKALRANG